MIGNPVTASTQAPKVMVFCVADLAKARGGVLWTRSLLNSLAQVADMECIMVSAGPADYRVKNDKFVESCGLHHIFVPFRKKPVSAMRAGPKRFVIAAEDLLSAFLDKYYFLGERTADEQRHIDAEVVAIVRERKPSLVIIKDIWSALYVPSVFSLEVPRCLTITDNDADFHRAFRAEGGRAEKGVRSRLLWFIMRHGNWVSNRRFQSFVNYTYTSCNGIVALTHADLPTDLPGNVVRSVLPPLLNESASRWSYQASRRVLFVGNVSHFANRLAIEWICNRLAPELYKIDLSIRINIIGASEDQVRCRRKWENVCFLGEASQEEVTHHMTTDDLFIAPIANHFGAKLKLAECASHKMPFVATNPAMSGLPFLAFIPKFSLERPRAAARLLVECVNSPEALTRLSSSIAARMQQARAEQVIAWSDFLNSLIGSCPE